MPSECPCKRTPRRRHQRRRIYHPRNAYPSMRRQRRQHLQQSTKGEQVSTRGTPRRHTQTRASKDSHDPRNKRKPRTRQRTRIPGAPTQTHQQDETKQTRQTPPKGTRTKDRKGSTTPPENRWHFHKLVVARSKVKPRTLIREDGDYWSENELLALSLSRL